MPPELGELAEQALTALAALRATGVMVLDRGLHVVMSGGEVLTSYGYEPEEVAGRSVADILTENATARLVPHFEAALRGEQSVLLYERSDGEHWYDMQIGPISAAGEVVGVLVLLRDMTDLQRIEVERDDIERRYRELVDHSSDVVTRSDERGIFCYVSPACERVYGWRPQDMLGRPVREFLHPDDLEAHAAMRAALAAGEQLQTAELRMRHADGGWAWVEMRISALRHPDGSLREVQAAARDITDRRSAQHARSIADEQFRTAFDHAPIGMALVAHDGSLLRVNPALCNILGYSQDELLTMDFQGLTHPDDLEADLALVQQVLDGRISEYQLEKRYIRADGESVWALLNVSLVRDAAREPLHVIAQVQDVSQRKHLEARLRRLATFDDLTGLYNRREFQRALAEQQRRVRRYGEAAAVLLVDLDGFKAVNDTYGHHIGDALLTHVARILTERLRDSDISARLGGDEFAVLLPHTDAASASGVAEAIDRAVQDTPLEIDGITVTACASIGVAALAADAGEGDALRAADRAMYEVKRRRQADGA